MVQDFMIHKRASRSVATASGGHCAAAAATAAARAAALRPTRERRAACRGRLRRARGRATAAHPLRTARAHSLLRLINFYSKEKNNIYCFSYGEGSRSTDDGCRPSTQSQVGRRYATARGCLHANFNHTYAYSLSPRLLSRV